MAYKAWAGVRLPTAVTNSRHLHTHGKGHMLQKSATHLTLSHLLSCTYGGHCTWRHNVVRVEFFLTGQRGWYDGYPGVFPPRSAQAWQGQQVPRYNLTFRRTDLKTIDIRGGARHYDVAITHPTMARKDHYTPQPSHSGGLPWLKNRSIARTGAMKRLQDRRYSPCAVE